MKKTKINSLHDAVLAKILSFIDQFQQKMNLRLVNNQFWNALEISSAWTNVKSIQIHWQGSGGQLHLNSFHTRTLDADEMLEAMTCLMPKCCQCRQLTIISEVRRRSETFYENFSSPDQFWSTLALLLQQHRFVKVQQSSFHGSYLGLPSELSVPQQVLHHLNQSLVEIRLFTLWRQFENIDNFMLFARHLSCCNIIRKLSLAVGDWADHPDSMNMDEIYLVLADTLPNLTNLIDFELKTEYTPSDLSSIVRLVNSLTPSRLHRFHLQSPAGEGLDFCKFWNEVSSDVVIELRELEFNLRLSTDQSIDWLLRIPILCPKLRFLRCDYVHKSPLTANQLVEVLSEWFWTLGLNRDLQVYWWPIERQLHLPSTVEPLTAIMNVVVRGEIGSNLCWVILSDEDKHRHLNVCLKRC